jgi:diketogulonate reductase-like aldo/keto reductase
MSETEQFGPYEIPGIGLGTLRRNDDEGVALVEAALAEGYRHVDTAEYYGNEVAVGKGIARSSVPREDIWLTTKILHPKAPRPPDVRTAAEASLRRLGVDYVDALLIHWPNDHAPLAESLEVFAALREEGLTRTIGVSNFPTALLDEAASLVDGLVTNQVEYHVYLDQSEVLDAVRGHGMVLTAHTPLARGEVLDDPVLAEIAAGRGMTIAQVALRWLVQQERVIAIPGGDPEHVDQLRDNLAVLELSLDDEEMAQISHLARTRRIVDGAHAPVWD